MSEPVRYEIRNELEALERQHRLVFAVSCCERLLPNYEAFEAVENWGDSSILRGGLAIVLSYIQDPDFDVQQLNDLCAMAMALVPDVDDFETMFATLALYAAGSVVDTMRACISDNIDYIAGVSKFSIESIRQFVLVCITPGISGVWDYGWEKHASESPLMISELRKQEHDLRLLRGLPKLTPEFIREFRASNDGLGIRPIERGLVKGNPKHFA
jgi:uncharacterized protein YjaG (DUF416 family)